MTFEIREKKNCQRLKSYKNLIPQSLLRLGAHWRVTEISWLDSATRKPTDIVLLLSCLTIKHSFESCKAGEIHQRQGRCFVLFCLPYVCGPV